MAKTESTAVNELIDLMQNQRPVPPQPDDGGDLFAAPASRPTRMTSTIPPMRGAGEVAPLPRGRAPQATAEHAVPGDVARASRAALGQWSSDDDDVVPRVRMTAASPARGTTIPPLARRSAAAGTMPPPSAPVAAPFDVQPASRPSAAHADPFAATAPVSSLPPLVTPPDAAEDLWHDVGTSTSAGRHAETIALAKRMIVPTIVLTVAMVGAYFAFIDNGAKAKAPRATPAARAAVKTNAAVEETETVLRPALPRVESENAGTASAGGEQPEPPTRAEQAADVAAASMTHDAPKAAVDAVVERAAKVAESGAPSVREVQTSRGVIKLVDVRIDSTPAGATVTLVDGGKQSFLGSTPLSTSVDPSRQYDVIIALDGRPTQMVHLDPTSTSRLDVALGRAHRARSSSSSSSSTVSAPASARAARVQPAAPATTETESPVTEAVTGKGTLMISSKPPCEILIDGEATGLTTPQRSIELAAGIHKVTLVNEAAGIKKTLTVKITANEPTKLIQDLMTE